MAAPGVRRRKQPGRIHLSTSRWGDDASFVSNTPQTILEDEDDDEYEDEGPMAPGDLRAIENTR